MNKSRTPTASMLVLARTKNTRDLPPLTLEEAWTVARGSKHREWRNYALQRLVALARTDRALDQELGTFLQELDASCPLGVVESYAEATRRPEFRMWARTHGNAIRQNLGMEPRRWANPRPPYKQKRAA